MGGAHSLEKGWTFGFGTPTPMLCWNDSPALVSAALVDTQRGGQTTLNAPLDPSGTKPLKLESPTDDLYEEFDVYRLI
ncbi:jg15229 [Pararge aegeria aegeria]|uniref:Jg15229 protein n=1 Tax=Pararge aegeria aegeria TaxID=348720 RepID=A0A8S4RD10_9NEOP|nr:jg15229 [Pararge aegeria aegeria]